MALIIPAWLAVTFATARSAYFYATRRRERQLVELADRLAALARELVPERSALRKPSGA